MVVWHMAHNKPREADDVHDKMKGSYLGPAFSDAEIERYLNAKGYPYEKPADRTLWAKRIAQLIDEGKVIGLNNGRMEFGPRALGGRSIIGDARSPQMQTVMNLKIKYRESFRPFAPSCLEERKGDYFDLDCPSPYMLLVAQVKASRCKGKQEARNIPVRERINQIRSDVPAITHVDYSARVQTVSKETNPDFHAIIKAFEERTGYAIIINTSFNVRGEPIVCTPEDAYRCFMRTEMDYLVLGSCIVDKTRQPPWQDKGDWRRDYVLD
jgi:carbamoyltransferase